MENESNNKSVKVRNYAIAIFCAVFAILPIIFFVKIFSWQTDLPPINTWSECQEDKAYVYINAMKEVRDVKCVALDKEFIIEDEIIIGDLLDADEDVCKFKLQASTTEPLKFEIWYNGKVKKEVCDWASPSGFFD